MTGYVGRFAPSPTGPLHFGSLLTALASFLDARAAGGRWLLRIEDIDTPRTQPAYTSAILKALQDYGLEWDGVPMFQSRRFAAYRDAFQRLEDRGLVFLCRCSRRGLEEHAIYPGTCRNRRLSGEAAGRVRAPDRAVTFDDAIQGPVTQNLARDVGDFVVKRRDGVFAYQLAVVVDDDAQGVTHVIRGANLLDSTPRQLFLYEALGRPPPHHAHLPVAIDRGGHKLSKHAGAAPLDGRTARADLHLALTLLGQEPPDTLYTEPANVQLRWAIAHWRLTAVPSGSKIEHFVCG